MTAPTVRVWGLAVLEILVTDLARAARFYQDILGFEMVEESPPGVLLHAPALSLYLEGGHEPTTPDPRRTRLSPSFSVDRVREAHDALAAAGVPVVIPYQAFSESFALFAIADPDGNVLGVSGAP